MSRGRAVAILAGSLVGGTSALVYASYRRSIRRARERVSVGSRVVETACGPIECAIAGEGPAVLIVHGAGGGFDQGMDFAEPLVRSGFQVIAVSRFGYLRTPLPADASAEAQADAHASLLDMLKIERAAVLGASAGAPSAMQLAIRHPERTAALILMVPAAYPFNVAKQTQRVSAETRLLFDTALKSDFLFWAAPRIARRTLIRGILGTRPSVVESASAEEQARAAEVLAHILPIRPRRLGLLNDAAVTSSLTRYDLERIEAPTLILGFEDCLYGTYSGARYSAEHIPGARLVSYPTGGHLWVGHQAEVIAEISGFLRVAGGPPAHSRRSQAISGSTPLR